MPPFATEAGVRLTFQISDTVQAPPELLEAAVLEAHELLLPRLLAGIDMDTPPPLLVTAETLLAGACALRGIAARDAFAQKHVTVGGQHIAPGNRFAALTAAARAAEAQAWETAAPYLKAPPAAAVPELTPTVPLLE